MKGRANDAATPPCKFPPQKSCPPARNGCSRSTAFLCRNRRGLAFDPDTVGGRLAWVRHVLAAGWRANRPWAVRRGGGGHVRLGARPAVRSCKMGGLSFLRFHF